MWKNTPNPTYLLQSLLRSKPQSGDEEDDAARERESGDVVLPMAHSAPEKTEMVPLHHHQQQLHASSYPLATELRPPATIAPLRVLSNDPGVCFLTLVFPPFISLLMRVSILTAVFLSLQYYDVFFNMFALDMKKLTRCCCLSCSRSRRPPGHRPVHVPNRLRHVNRFFQPRFLSFPPPLPLPFSPFPIHPRHPIYFFTTPFLFIIHFF